MIALMLDLFPMLSELDFDECSNDRAVSQAILFNI